jgi:hypothetical protein
MKVEERMPKGIRSVLITDVSYGGGFGNPFA